MNNLEWLLIKNEIANYGHSVFFRDEPQSFSIEKDLKDELGRILNEKEKNNLIRTNGTISLEIIEKVSKVYSPIDHIFLLANDILLDDAINYTILLGKKNILRKNQIGKDVIFLSNMKTKNKHNIEKYLDFFTPYEAFILNNFGFDSEQFNELDMKFLQKQFKTVCYYTKAAHRYKDYELIGYGASSIILLNKNQNIVFKCSSDYEAISKEYEVLNALNQKNESNNLIQISQDNINADVSGNFALRLKYCEGVSLFQYLRKKGALSTAETLSISKDIFNGLYYLHKNGYYHRDLHDRNVMVNNKGVGVVIDLGTASKDPNNIHPLNRAYGGNNDLISLGQLMYKMKINKNLFNFQTELSDSVHIKNQIKSNRNFIYSNSECLTETIQKVQKNIPEKNLETLIVHLINRDINIQPNFEEVEKTKQLFDKYHTF